MPIADGMKTRPLLLVSDSLADGVKKRNNPPLTLAEAVVAGEHDAESGEKKVQNAICLMLVPMLE